MVKMIETKKGFFVVEETDTQYLSLTDCAFASKTEFGAEYVGRHYATKKAATRAARYYSNKK